MSIYPVGSFICWFKDKEQFTGTILKIDYETESYVVLAVYGLDLIAFKNATYTSKLKHI